VIRPLAATTLGALALLSTDAQTGVRDRSVKPLAPTPTAISKPDPTVRRCPPEMVDVAGLACVDRWEMSLADRASGRFLSPYYHPNPALAQRDRREWSYRARQLGNQAARETPLPDLPAWQLAPEIRIVAVSAPDRIPSAYLDLESAKLACENAGKRLCKDKEWQMACRSEHNTRHPYGEMLDSARCNLAARVSPTDILHGKSIVGERDARLNLVEQGGRTLLRPTGSLLGCASAWEDDGIYDMEGNLDEWVDDPSGVFRGGFYGRETHWGCDQHIDVHSPDYYDYSIGARCCL
jgi:hypothetical protein